VCDIVVKKFTFAISSPDEFLLTSIMHATFPEVWELERLQTAKVTFEVFKGHRNGAIRQATYDILLVFNLSMSLSVQFSRYSHLFLKI